jgi:hypothetical protein
MHGLAVVTERLLREPLWITALLGALSPSVSVRVQRHSLDSKPLAPLLEFGCAVTATNGPQVWKQRASRWQAAQNHLDFIAEMDHRETASLLASVGNRSVGKVNIFRVKVRNVGLGPAKMPAQFVKASSLLVFFTPNDEEMFFNDDRSFGLVVDFRPEAFRYERPR